MAKHNRVQATKAPGHEGIAGKETADGSECPFTGPEPACGISVGVANRTVKAWTNRDHRKHWDYSSGLKQTKKFIQGPFARRTKELLKLNTNQLQWLSHVFKLGLTNSPICERCLEKEESAIISWKKVITRTPQKESPSVISNNSEEEAQQILKGAVQGPDEFWPTPYIHTHKFGLV
jgi:hypothetical protein